MASTVPEKIIYSMIGVAKSFDRKVILKDIYLSYFYGAKIGVLGLNGSGKSTLLRSSPASIRTIDGKMPLQPGYTIGYLEQEPLARRTRAPSARSSRRAMQRPLMLVNEFNAISDKLAEPMDDVQMNKLLEKQGSSQEKIDHLERLGHGSPARHGDGRPALSAGRSAVRPPFRRRAAPRRPLPPAAAEARRSHPRRAHQPSRRRIRPLARAAPEALRRHRHRGDPRPLLLRQRGRLDPRARPRREGIPWKGNYSSWLEQKRPASRWKRSSSIDRPEVLAQRAGMGPPDPPRPPGQEQGPHRSVTRHVWRKTEEQRAADEIFIPPGPRLGQKVIEARTSPRPTATSALRQCELLTPPNADRRRSSAPTAPARPRFSG